MSAESWPQPTKSETPGEQLDAMFEKAKGALMDAIIEKIKGDSAEDAKAALQDLLVFDRVSMLVLDADESYDYKVGQEQIDDIAQRYGIKIDFSIEKFKELAKQVE